MISEPDAANLADRLLAAVGGGETLHVGHGADVVAGAFRARGVTASTCSQDRAASDLTGKRSTPFDLVCVHRAPAPDRNESMAALLAQRGWTRALFVDADRELGEAWERWAIAKGWRKHPRCLELAPYEGLDWGTRAWLLFEPVRSQTSVERELDTLRAGRELHMDMLREAGRRADAHVARYALASQFVRPEDRVLDAACGLGYGSALLEQSTLCTAVTGIDLAPSAVAYAQAHYASARVRFEVVDVEALAHWPPASFDVVVSFETVEHLEQPDAFLAACRRLLTPGGRFVCSVPNLWIDANGRDPNPHHRHVFDRQRLETLCSRHFAVEQVFGQTAGGGMKLPSAVRRLWPAGANEDAEWWVLVGMVDPATSVDPQVAFRSGLVASETAENRLPLAFQAWYENPWLARAMVSIGLRTASPALLAQFAEETLATAPAASADAGAALCVLAYRALESAWPVEPTLMDRIETYCGDSTDNPHVKRWQISLRYVEGLLWLQAEAPERAEQALEACALADPLAFNPLLATKTVEAAWLLGWRALQRRDAATARRWWRHGLARAEAAMHRPWKEMLIDPQAPPLFAMREAAQVVDLASQCASGLHLLSHAADRPGLTASQIWWSLNERARRAEREWRISERQTNDLCAQLAERAGELEEARATLQELRRSLPASTLLAETGKPIPPHLKVAVFGTGEGGRRAYAALSARGARIACFADNDRARWGQALCGVPIIDPAMLPEWQPDLIAVASLPGREAIFAQLAHLGYQRGRHYDSVSVSG